MPALILNADKRITLLKKFKNIFLLHYRLGSVFHIKVSRTKLSVYGSASLSGFFCATFLRHSRLFINTDRNYIIIIFHLQGFYYNFCVLFSQCKSALVVIFHLLYFLFAITPKITANKIAPTIKVKKYL